MPAVRRTNVLVILAAAVCVAASAAAQTPQRGGTPGNLPQTGAWTVEFGYQSFWQRGVGRTTRPLDASPVSWKGDGPGMTVLYDRATSKRLHRVAFSWSSAGHFVYDAVGSPGTELEFAL